MLLSAVRDVDTPRGVQRDTHGAVQSGAAAHDCGARGRVSGRPGPVDRDAVAIGIGDVEMARGVERDARRRVEPRVAAYDRGGRGRGPTPSPAVHRNAVAEATTRVAPRGDVQG